MSRRSKEGGINLYVYTTYSGSSGCFFPGADTARRTDLAFIVWVLKSTGPETRSDSAGARTVLFDAGFYREKFLTQWKPFDFVQPSEAVRGAGDEDARHRRRE